MNTRSVYDLPMYNMFYARSGCEFAKDRASPEVMSEFRETENSDMGTRLCKCKYGITSRCNSRMPLTNNELHAQ